MTDAPDLNTYPGKTPIIFCGLRLKKDWVGEAESSLGSTSLIGGIHGICVMGCQ